MHALSWGDLNNYAHPTYQYTLVWSLNGPLKFISPEEIPKGASSTEERKLWMRKGRKLKVGKDQKTQSQERHSRNPHSHVGLQVPLMETKQS